MVEKENKDGRVKGELRNLEPAPQRPQLREKLLNAMQQKNGGR